MTIEIYSRDIEIDAHGETSGTFTFRCPECSDEVVVAQAAGWWDEKCSCGYKWHIKLFAYTDDDVGTNN